MLGDTLWLVQSCARFLIGLFRSTTGYIYLFPSSEVSIYVLTVYPLKSTLTSRISGGPNKRGDGNLLTFNKRRGRNKRGGGGNLVFKSTKEC